ncbi:MAG: nitrite reductase small subunit NirD [Solirubrobacteraceae bacterium]|nr:nitrite reductase small subunit NirD [Solirubrobacteraceae bacterium]
MTFACREDDVPPGEGRNITIEGRRIALFRTDTGWYAVDAVCPHKGGPLADGIVCDHAVTCPLHDRSFDLRTGEGPGEDRIGTYAVEVRAGEVYVAVGVPAASPVAA